ncbi:hypothetical protein D3C73_1053760 [compost metagenome]
MRVAAAALAVDGDTASRTQVQLTLSGQSVLGTNTGGENNQVGLKELITGKIHPVAVLTTRGDRLSTTRQVNTDAQSLDSGLQRLASVVIQLHRHQPWGELHHMGFQAEALEGVGRLQTE